MNFFDRVRFLFGVKASQTRTVATRLQIGQAVSTPANYESFSRQGYAKNLIVRRCVSLIADACGGIEWELYSGKGKKKSEIESHAFLELIENPNPMQSRAEFVTASIAYFLLAGNSYIEQTRFGTEKIPLELWPARPDRMKIIAGKDGYPQAYEYNENGNKKLFPIDVTTLSSDILHMKTFNPLNAWYGMSLLESGMGAVDMNNAGLRWNLALLQNSAVPSGVLQVSESKGNPRASLSEQQFKRLKADLEEHYTGARNSGRPMVLEGGLTWESMSLSPKEMDFLNSKEVTESDIGTLFGVPDALLGLGEMTYNNYQEARLAFYEETVLPLMDKFIGHFNRSIVPQFGEGLSASYNPDDIEALQYKRTKKFEMIKDATFLDQNEKRVAAGYDEKPGWDVFLINNQLVKDPAELLAGSSQTSEDGSQTESDEQDPNAEDEEGLDKPKPGKPVEDDETEDDSEEQEKALHEFEFKAFNLINRVEKQTTWKKQNRHRIKLTKSLSRDLETDLNRMAKMIAEASKTSKEKRVAEFAMQKAIDEAMSQIESTLARHMRYAIEDFGGAIISQAKKSGLLVTESKARKSKFEQYIDAYIKERTGKAISEISGTTHKQVTKLVQKLTSRAIQDGDADFSLGKYADEIQEQFEGLSRSRANTIARTEVAMASNNGSLNAVKTLELPNMQKEWVSADDERVRGNEPDHQSNEPDHAAMDGKLAPLEEKFTVPPDASMDCPGDSSAGADQVCNCRCVLVYKAGKEN